MFFYRFSCFISLVTNVTKKSSKSFWDRKGLCNQFAWVGLGQKGFEAVFSGHSWYFGHKPSAAQAFTAAQDSSAFALSPDFGNRADFGNSFGNSFGNKIFSEQLCFSIDLAVSSLLLPMLPKNPQKVSGIGKVYAISLHG